MGLDRTKKIILTVSVFLIFIIGGMINWDIYDDTDKKIKDDLFDFAESITAAINPDRVRTITATGADLDNPDYARLNEQLETVQKYLKKRGVRWSYLVFKRDDKYLFSVDSIATGQYGHSEPGDEYKEVPDDLVWVFENKKTVITGKYNDEWGQYVSAFVPIVDFNTKELLAVAGYDIDSAYYQKQINQQLVAPTIIILIFLIVFIVMFVLIGRRLDLARLIKESEDKFRLITEHALDPIVMMDEKGMIVLWNEAAEKTYGYKQEEVVGKYLHNLIIPPNKYDIEHSQNLKIFSQTGKSPVLGKLIELETINRSGGIVPIELSVAAIKMSGKNYAIGIIRDISLRKENEDRMEEKNRQLENGQKAMMNILEDMKEEKSKTEALLSGIGDGVVAVDNKSTIIYINQVAEKYLGFTSAEMVGKNFSETVTIKDGKGKLLAEGKRPFTIAIRSGKTVSTATSTPLYYRRKDGSKFPVAITVSPIRIDGKVSGAIDVFKDISHEIEVDQMKTDFISLASHQLRTPLSAIRWFGEMLLNGDAGKLTKEQLGFVENIVTSNERMIALVNSLLNISRIESGRIIVDPEPTDLGKLVKEVLAEIDNKIEEKKQRVIVSIHTKLPKIKVDPKLIREVYKNLLTNANKYTQIGGEITIIISKKDKEIWSQISDNGLGIPVGDQPKIYEKFYRAQNVVKLETEGTGLGLYLAKSIVDSSGGKMWFESQEKKGTSFWFTLPMTGSKPKKGEVTINS